MTRPLEDQKQIPVSRPLEDQKQIPVSPVIVGKDVLDAIWDEEKARRLKDTVWSGISPSIGRPAFVVQKTWDNPYPDKTIQSLDLISENKEATIVVFAITLE